MLQKVEQFPWEVTEKLESNLVKDLGDMRKLKLINSDNKAPLDNIDHKEAWPELKETLEKVLNCG